MKIKFSALIFILSCSLTHLTAQTWSVDALLNARRPTTVATLGSKMLILGGNIGNNSTVDIYDDDTKKFDEFTLSFRDFKTKAVPLGNKVYCFQGSDLATGEFSNKLDIYDATTHTWKRDSLPFICLDVAAGSIGSKLFIAGGKDLTSSSGDGTSNLVRIFDTTTQKWSYTPALSVARRDMQVVKVKNKLLFIGGFSENPFTAWDWTFYKNIDIYDETTKTWSSVLMKTGRINPTVTVSGSKVLIIGGIYKLDFVGATPTLFFTKSVEIYDVDSNTWQTADLPKAHIQNGIATYDKKAYLICGSTQTEPSSERVLEKNVKIYDFVTNTWSETPFYAQDFARIGWTAGFKNRIYFIGGSLANSNTTARIDILTLPPSNIFEPTVLSNKLSVFPNPTSDELTVDFERGDIPEYTVKVSNPLGQTFYTQQNIQTNSVKIDLRNLNKGLYFLTIQSGKGIKTSTFFKI